MKPAFEVCVCTRVYPLGAQEAPQAQQTAEVPDRPDWAPNHIEIDDAQVCPADYTLQGSVGRQDVDLPAIRFGDPSETEYDAGDAAEARVSHDVEDADRLACRLCMHSCHP